MHLVSTAEMVPVIAKDDARPGSHPRQQLPSRKPRCLSHRWLAAERCVCCGARLCPRCEQLLINDRVWCWGCGKRYRPTLIKNLWATAALVARLCLFIGSVAATVLYAPMPLGARAYAAVAVGLILGWALFLQDEHKPLIKVEKPSEAANRARVRAARHRSAIQLATQT